MATTDRAIYSDPCEVNLEREVEELHGEVGQLQGLVEKRGEWMEAVLGFVLSGAEDEVGRLQRVVKRCEERLGEQRRVARVKERGIRLVYALKARELQEQTGEGRKECEQSTKERDAALERERTTAAQLALLQHQHQQNPAQSQLIETLKTQIHHLQTEKDELVREEVRRLRHSEILEMENMKEQLRHMREEREALVREEVGRVRVGCEMRVGMQSRVIGELRAWGDEMSREVRELRNQVEQGRTLKAEYVRMFGEVGGLQEELVAREGELRDARREVDEMKMKMAKEKADLPEDNFMARSARSDHAAVPDARLSGTRLEDMVVEVLKGRGGETEISEGVEAMDCEAPPAYPGKRRRVE